jgi:hypothetical protein
MTVNVMPFGLNSFWGTSLPQACGTHHGHPRKKERQVDEMKI